MSLKAIVSNAKAKCMIGKGLVAVALFLILAAMLSLAPVQGDAYPIFSYEGQKTVQLQQEIRSLMEQYYVEEIDWGSVDVTSVESIFDSLGDPYSGYFTPGEFVEFITNLEGGFGGIGVYIEQVDGYLTIVAPMDGSPAEQVGLKSLDRIIEVDGLSIRGMPLWQAIELIKGEPGTVVNLTILRQEESLNFAVNRELIMPNNVTGEMLDGQIGFVQIFTFGEKTKAELEEVLADLTREGAVSFIIDLRNNGGGYLDSALGAAELLVPTGDIVHVTDRFEGRETFSTSGNGLGKPMVVLVNEGTASAAEILAAAIAENDTGLVVGTTTFGKASVQAMVELSNGGVVKLTVATYLTPNGNNINGIGFTPDMVVADYHLQLEQAKEVLLAEVTQAKLQQQKLVVSLFIGLPNGEVAGREVSLEEAPFISNGRTYVPIRFVSEQLGLQVDWQENTGEVIILAAGHKIKMQPGSNKVSRDGIEHTLDAPVLLENGRSYLPARHLVELIGGEIEWLEESRQVNFWLQK